MALACRIQSMKLALFSLSVVLTWHLSGCELHLEGITANQFTLLSYEDGASCEQHKPHLCGTNAPNPDEINEHEVTSGNKCSTLNCSWFDQYKSNCLISKYSPPDVTYQFVHYKKGNPNYTYHFNWSQLLPEECDVQFHLFILSEHEPSDDTCDAIKGMSHCYYYNISDDPYIYIHFKRFSMPTSDNWFRFVRYFKVIAYPVYEWPVVIFLPPGYCEKDRAQYYLPNDVKCETCDGGCTVDESQVQNFEVHEYRLDSTISTGITWTTEKQITRFYLHINTTDQHYLYWINGTITEVNVTGMSVGAEYEIWMEKYNCGCSQPTEKYSIGNASDVIPPISLSSITTINPTRRLYATPNPVETSTIISSVHNDIILMSSHLTTVQSTLLHSSSSISVLVSQLSSMALLASNLNEPTSSMLPIYIIPAVIVVVILVLIAVIIVVIIVKRRSRKKFCTCYSSKPPVVQPANPTLPLQPVLSPHPMNIMLIHSTETKEKKLLEILTFLSYDLEALHDEYGKKLFRVYQYDMSTERLHPSEWLDKHYKNCEYVICVVGKKFKQEWNDEVRPDMPLVYAFHQLFTSSFTSCSDPLSKIIVVLRNKQKDEKHIPSEYLLGRKRFSIEDTDGLASYMLGRPKHTFITDNNLTSVL